MKITTTLFAAFVMLASCAKEKSQKEPATSPGLSGTWKLVSSQIITKGDTVNTFPVANQEMIKMFTDKEFSFFKHNIRQITKDSAVFEAGSGTYTLTGEKYAEHLTYCNYREWENHHFDFNLRLQNDTLTQTGTEKIDSLGINREIVEIYVKK